MITKRKGSCKGIKVNDLVSYPVNFHEKECRTKSRDEHWLINYIMYLTRVRELWDNLHNTSRSRLSFKRQRFTASPQLPNHIVTRVEQTEWPKVSEELENKQIPPRRSSIITDRKWRSKCHRIQMLPQDRVANCRLWRKNWHNIRDLSRFEIPAMTST